MKILLVDDETMLGRFVETILQKYIDGVSIVQVLSCERALSTLPDVSFDLVLLDHGLARMSGLQCLKHMREEYPDLPIVMLTGYQCEELKDACMGAGADDYVVKTQMVDLLSHVVWSAVRRRQAKRKIDNDVFAHQEVLRRIQVKYM